MADLLLFDPETVIDRADCDDPMPPVAGIRQVMLAGRTVSRGDAGTGNRPEEFLQRRVQDSDFKGDWRVSFVRRRVGRRTAEGSSDSYPDKTVKAA